MPADNPPLRVWLWPSNLSEGQILAAAAQAQASGATLISDPAEDQWTHVLSWDGAHWALEKAGDPDPISLGAPLTADAIKTNLAAGAKLWVNLPPSQELAAKLKPSGTDSAVQSADNLAAAQYALTGVLTANGPAYAWYHKSELAAGPPRPMGPLTAPVAPRLHNTRCGPIGYRLQARSPSMRRVQSSIITSRCWPRSTAGCTRKQPG